jgi:hypothetical protein
MATALFAALRHGRRFQRLLDASRSARTVDELVMREARRPRGFTKS